MTIERHGRNTGLRQRGRWWWGSGLGALAVVLLWSWWVGQRDADAAAAPSAPVPVQNATAAAGPAASSTASAPAAALLPGAPLSAQGLAERRAELALWHARLQRAQQALDAYLTAARYPHESRPIDEHPDQVRPFALIAEDRALRVPGGSAAQDMRLKTTQERVFASGNESSRITVTLQDLQGRTLPLRVTRAVMRELTPPGRTATTADYTMPLLAEAGKFVAVMQPAAQGFSTFAGTLRLEMNLEYAGQPGYLYFDLTYSPDTAALWLGRPHDALERGSLVFTLPLQVLLPGRYVASGRVDDANGRPVAIALFNQELPAGAGEIRLPVFGKLVLDKQPALPLKLRDVEAFLLRENTFPDRVMLPRLAGVVATSQAWPLAAFAGDAWASEERDRYLAELGKDVDEAKAKVRQLGP